MTETTKLKVHQGVHDAFVISVFAKGVFAFFQTVLGAMLLFVGETTALIYSLAQNELLEDPSDFMSNWAEPLLQPPAEAHVFGGLYLLSHGAVKIFLVTNLLRGRMWSYPAALGVFTVFVIYQLFRYFFKTHSPVLLGITIVDIIVIGLVYYEYRQALRRDTL